MFDFTSLSFQSNCMQRSYPSQLKRDKTELQENQKFTTFLITWQPCNTLSPMPLLVVRSRTCHKLDFDMCSSCRLTGNNLGISSFCPWTAHHCICNTSSNLLHIQSATQQVFTVSKHSAWLHYKHSADVYIIII